MIYSMHKDKKKTFNMNQWLSLSIYDKIKQTLLTPEGKFNNIYDTVPLIQRKSPIHTTLFITFPLAISFDSLIKTFLKFKC